jgi:hypothetical protein
MTPFTLFLHRHLDRMRPLLRERVPMRIALHRHPGVHGVVEAAEEILCAVPGIEVIELEQPAVGLQANNLRVLPQRPASTEEDFIEHLARGDFCHTCIVPAVRRESEIDWAKR